MSSTNASSSTNATSASQVNTSVVANNFVFKYYSILNKDPNSLFHFYKDNSVLTRGEDPNAPEDTTYGKENIKQKIQSLNFQDCQVALTVVDSQPSLDGSVLINAVGTLSNKKEQPKKFIQTFLLAVQTDPNGYYVRNDIFRYLRDDLPGDVSLSQPQVAHQQPKTVEPQHQPEATQQPQTPTTPASTSTATTTTPVVEEPKVTPSSTSTSSSSPAQPTHQPQQATKEEEPKKVEKTEVAEPKKEHVPAATSTTATTTTSTTSAATESPAAPEKKQDQHHERQEKKQPAATSSSSSKDQHPAPVATKEQPQQRQPKKQEREKVPEKPKQPLVPTWATIATSPQGIAPPPQLLLEKQKEVQRAEEEKIKETIDNMPIDRSLFVTNLPFSVTEEKVRAVFSHHAEVKLIVLKRGTAFIELATPDQAKALIEKNSTEPIVIDHRQLGVDQKKRTKFPARDGKKEPRENRQDKEGAGPKREKKSTSNASHSNNHHHGNNNHVNHRQESGNAKDHSSTKRERPQGNKQQTSAGGDNKSSTHQSRTKANNQ